MATSTAKPVVGIDGGGTKTAAVILALDGHVLGYGEGGASTYGVVAPQVTIGSIAEAVERASTNAGLHAPAFSAAFLGLGNVVSEQDRAAVRQMALDLRLAPEEAIGVDHDIRIALAGGLAGRPGIVQILGTGSSCFGRSTAGESWRAGGWGPLIDDGGSGYWLGIQAMHAAVAGYDGRGQPTLLTQQITAALQLRAMDELMNRLYAQHMSRTEIGALARLVFAAAQQGDAVAQAVLLDGCEQLAKCVAAVAQRLGMHTSACEVALAGGLTRAGEIYLHPLTQAIQRRLPQARVQLAELAPALGAGLLALQMANGEVEPQVVENLRQGASRCVGKAE